MVGDIFVTIYYDSEWLCPQLERSSEPCSFTESITSNFTFLPIVNGFLMYHTLVITLILTVIGAIVGKIISMIGKPE